ncbi:DUF4296 domain-containing protein [Sphingobacterium hungaricum]|nr:DUF4296 domain-containing protein [Sphingobacterium hungaricum]
MQRLLYSILLSFFVFISCTNSLPKGILSEKKMTSLLKEVQVMDAYLSTLPVDSAKKVINSYYDVIFDKYDLDSTSFATNLDYYLSHPTEAEKLYDNVLVSLREEQTQINKTDSIRNVVIQDSVNRVARLHEDMMYRRSLITNVHLDSTALTYQDVQRIVYTQIPFRLNAYGYDIQPLPQPVPAQVPLETIREQPAQPDALIERPALPAPSETRIPLQTKPVIR